MLETEVVALCQAGRADQFEVLFERYRTPAMRLAFTITENRALAEDVVQDSFVRAWRAIRNIRPGQPFGPWFYAIVSNRARDALLHRHFFGWLPLLSSGETAGPKTEDVLSVVDRNEIWDAVRRLPVDLRTVVGMRYALDLSEQEVAEATGVPVGTVKSRLHRAKEMLRADLASAASHESEGTNHGTHR